MCIFGNVFCSCKGHHALDIDVCIVSVRNVSNKRGIRLFIACTKKADKDCRGQSSSCQWGCLERHILVRHLVKHNMGNHFDSSPFLLDMVLENP